MSSAAVATLAGLGTFDINPIHWLGDAAAGAAADVWKSAMVALWSAGLWLLRLAFQVIGAFTTVDLSASGPMGPVLPVTLWIALAVAGLLMLLQLVVVLVRRDGRSLGRVVLGVLQFGGVWASYLTVAAGIAAAAGGLATGILQAMLGVGSLSSFDFTAGWVRQVDDTTVATVLGVLSLLLVIPSAFTYLVVMVVRSTAEVVLACTSPISAAGLLSESTRAWFWKSVRWFVASVSIAPTAALMLGIGVKVSQGVVSGAGDSTAAATGTAVIGAVLIAVGAVCPLVLFRLLAFVDPGTASGAALRQSWADTGGLSGLSSRLDPGGQPATGSAATQSGPDGRSSGEAGAESQTRTRMAGALGAFGSAMATATSLTHRAVDLGSDVLGQAGVGSPGYSMTPTDERASRRSSNLAGTPSEPGGGNPGPGPGGSQPPPTPAGQAPSGPAPHGPAPQGPAPAPPTQPMPATGPADGRAGSSSAAGSGAAAEAATVAAL